MTVWHGSSCKVARPDLDHARDNTDFGRGFYVTPIRQQAKNWAAKFKRRGEAAVVSRYSFDEAAVRGLNVLQFTSYSDEWLSFVLTCRSGRDDSCYDIVSGGVANDRVFNTLELYTDGLIDKAEALRRLQYEKPNMQLCLRTAGALGLLQFEGSETL